MSTQTLAFERRFVAHSFFKSPESPSASEDSYFRTMRLWARPAANDNTL